MKNSYRLVDRINARDVVRWQTVPGRIIDRQGIPARGDRMGGQPAFHKRHIGWIENGGDQSAAKSGKKGS